MEHQLDFIRWDVKEELRLFREDLLHEFEDRWGRLIDPILMEIKAHREKEAIYWEQNRRTQVLLEAIAKKVGVAI